MKKFSLCILVGLLALVLYLEPFSVKAETLPGTDAPTVSYDFYFSGGIGKMDSR